MALFETIFPTIASSAGMIYKQKSSEHMARQQMGFQRWMSDTAHQRETGDLAAAGLNRILSISKGGPGASTPGGAMGQAEDPLTTGINTGLQAMRNNAEVDNMLQENKNLLETNSLIKANVAKAIAETELTASTAKNVQAATPKLETEAQLWIRLLQGVKSIDKHILQPIIDRLSTSTKSGKDVGVINSAIEDAKTLYQSTKKRLQDFNKSSPPKLQFKQNPYFKG